MSPDDDRGGPEQLGTHLEEVMAKVRSTTPPATPPLRPPDRSQGRDEARRALVAQRWHEMVPPKLHDARLEQLQDVTGGSEIIDWATAGDVPPWHDGVNLVLLGATGVGKSHAAVAAARAVIDQGRLCLYWPTPELLTALHWEAPDPRRVMAEAQRCAVLVLDDLGAEQPNEWTRRKLYELMNHRWNANLSTIATSNLEPRDLEDVDGPLGPRTYSRLAGGAIAVRLVGPDRRRLRA